MDVLMIHSNNKLNKPLNVAGGSGGPGNQHPENLKDLLRDALGKQSFHSTPLWLHSCCR